MHASSSSSSIKSFQNCSESDVKGYNDCPEFLFNLPTRSRSSTNLNKKRSISINFDTLNSDTFGNIRPAMTPPPPRTFKRVSSTGSSILSQVPAPYPTPISDTPNPLLNTSTPADLSDDQLIEKSIII
ncbi:hypothetical protein TBLA_0G01540 [Henningerozyma blattae CBS 6284]|uniref:Uncharacterized protein n=1 Tax=Henningerozyma blattae (strain ATCC 34711 / CBS 6284 / DSM 70876 / NBRC 10599 / NRRL Y-10934 / UCD 77-7) TaxID=1071380 RepID=I2H6U6_HENB6|nr:hypothetical protein TBLA_0G01540 [Tetrapisispora blattae CBS 6284]CCH62098.1 hypothetical protein TBLA_0G01540 [Tetrapisispora blattae CBS 6284]